LDLQDPLEHRLMDTELWKARASHKIVAAHAITFPAKSKKKKGPHAERIIPYEKLSLRGGGEKKYESQEGRKACTLFQEIKEEGRRGTVAPSQGTKM